MVNSVSIMAQGPGESSLAIPALLSDLGSGEEQSPDPQASIQAAAERALRSGPYPALKKLSCDYQDEVLVLRGCLPSYYLKQIAQEVVAHQVMGMGRLDNQIQVVRVVVLETPSDKVKRGVLDTNEGFEGGRRETLPDSDRRTGMGVKLMAPYGEEIEIDV